MIDSNKEISFEIRDMVEEDIELYFDSMSNLLKSEFDDWHMLDPEKFKNWLTAYLPSYDLDAIVCTDGFLPVGFFIGQTSSPVWSFGKMGRDILLYVIPQYRGRGISDMLIQKWIENLKLKGITRAISGYSLKSSEKHARQAYERSGFYKLGEIYARKL
jgi:GNAT superfamily N-acetyltransferase